MKKLSRDLLKDTVLSITPFDDLESTQIQETLQWIQSGSALYRIKKPDTPPKHLISYFVVFDEEAKKILLVDHKKALLWIPTGGHVEVDEDPKTTVERECKEELGITAEFWHDSPLFLTSVLTVGLTPGHTDVSLWYVLKGNHKTSYSFDASEFYSIQWFDFRDIPFEKSDIHMQRFVNKLQDFL